MELCFCLVNLSTAVRIHLLKLETGDLFTADTLSGESACSAIHKPKRNHYYKCNSACCMDHLGYSLPKELMAI